MYGTLLLGFVIVIIGGMAKVNYNYKYESGKNMDDFMYEETVMSRETLNVYSINREYLPYSEKNNEVADYITKRKNKIYILSGEATIIDETKNKLTLTCNLEKVSEGTKLELPFINYPGYKVTLKDKYEEKNIEYKQSEKGLIEIEIPAAFEKGELKIEYTGTILEKASYIISIISTILFIGYLIYTKRKDRLNDNKA